MVDGCILGRASVKRELPNLVDRLYINVWHRIFGWELYRSFLSVLKEGSLSGAARALGITQPTVGRHIAALEQALGVALFTRSQVGLNPTEAALGLRTYAETMESTAASLERAATAQRRRRARRGACVGERGDWRRSAAAHHRAIATAITRN